MFGTLSRLFTFLENHVTSGNTTCTCTAREALRYAAAVCCFYTQLYASDCFATVSKVAMLEHLHIEIHIILV